MSYLDEVRDTYSAYCADVPREYAITIAARADARIAELDRECEQWRDELRIYRETENKRIAELEQSVTVRDTEIARLRDALDQSALEYADLAVSAKSLEEHLHALVEVSEDSTIARARAVLNGDDIGEDDDEDAARAGNGGGVVSIGPKTTIKRSCADCEVCQRERYTCQSDSGTDVYCAHPSFPVRRIIGDTRWDTPRWCPAEPEIAARADARIAELESRITRMKTLLGECREVIAWECNELSNDPRGREDEHRRLGRLVDAIDTARAGNGGGV